jgi:hypothetical protein
MGVSVSISNTKQVFDFLRLLGGAAVRRVALIAVLSFLIVPAAVAKPVTYTGFTISDGKIGSWSFHNARVYFTLQSDTNNVQFIQPLIDSENPDYGTVDIWINQAGVASVIVVAEDKTVTATFSPGQIFVSVDLGDTPFPGDDPNVGGRGVGFGSITPEAGLQPAYPLGVEDGTIDYGDLNYGDLSAFPSPALLSLSLDLANDTRFSGRAFSCVGFPSSCLDAVPLHTNRGDFYLFEPYSFVDGYEPFGAGFFVAHVGGNDPNPSLPQLNATAPKPGTPITYRGYVIADVKLGQVTYAGAQVYLSMEADPATVVQTGSGGTAVYKNTGKTRANIISGSDVITADFNPGQIYVYYDVGHASVGFGSTTSTNETGYPLSITANEDDAGLVGNSLVGAVADLTATPTDAEYYTPATAALMTDLTNTTTLSGGASSCIGFDPSTSTCSTVTPTAIPLKTNKGDFYIYEPYRQDAGVDLPTYSVNWGVFWIEVGRKVGP